MKVGKRTGDIVSGFAWLLLGAWYLLEALRKLNFYTAGGQPGAGFMPMLLGGGVIVLSLMLIVKGFMSPPDIEGRFHVDNAVLKPVAVLGALVVWVVLFQITGYVLTGWLLVAGLIVAFAPTQSWRVRIGMAVLIAGLAVIGFYVVFGVIFALQLPPSPFLGI